MNQGKSTGHARKGKKKRREESPQAASAQEDVGTSDRQTGTPPGREHDCGKDGREGLQWRKSLQAQGRWAELLETLCSMSHTLHILETRGQAPGGDSKEGAAGWQRQLQEELERVCAELWGVEEELWNPQTPPGAGEVHEEEGPPKHGMENSGGPAATSDPLAEATFGQSPPEA